MGMFIISNLVGSTLQITTLPLPVLSTLQASGLVFNSICATIILGEPFTRWSLGGTLLVCTGAVLIAIFGAIPEPAHNLDQLLDLLGRRTFILWMLFQAVLVSLIIILASFLARFSTISSNPRIRLLRGLCYGTISGILSAHSLLVAKSAVELLIRTIIDRSNQFNRWQSWATLLGLVFFALTQLYYLHRGLKLVSTSVLYPLVFCIYNIIAILDGLIYFHQTSRLSPLHASLIALGTAILLSGVLALSWRLSDEQSHPSPPSALAPGLGFVEDTEDSSSDSQIDEESTLQHEALIRNEPMTPTTKLDTVLGATRAVRKTVRLRERDEIWGELDEESIPSPSISTHHSRTSRPSGEFSRPPLHPGPGEESTGEADENTALLSAARRRRRRSTGFPGFQARSERSTKRRNQDSREAKGGFWKMKWWKGKKSRRRERDGEGEGGSAV
jgi:hypothetical protein